MRGPPTNDEAPEVLITLIRAEALCAARGARLNDSGRRVLRAMLAASVPLKAYDLTYVLAKDGRSAAPPTVYRALKFLIGMGLAHRVERLNAYVACRFPGESHLAGFNVCERCGAAEEFRLEQIPGPIPKHGRWQLVCEVLVPCAACQAESGLSEVLS